MMADSKELRAKIREERARNKAIRRRQDAEMKALKAREKAPTRRRY